MRTGLWRDIGIENAVRTWIQSGIDPVLSANSRTLHPRGPATSDCRVAVHIRVEQAQNPAAAGRAQGVSLIALHRENLLVRRDGARRLPLE